MVACSSAFGFRTYRRCHYPSFLHHYTQKQQRKCNPPARLLALLAVRKTNGPIYCHFLSAAPSLGLTSEPKGQPGTKKKKKDLDLILHILFSPSLLGVGVSLQHIIAGPVAHLTLPCDEFCRVQHPFLLLLRPWLITQSRKNFTRKFRTDFCTSWCLPHRHIP